MTEYKNVAALLVIWERLPAFAGDGWATLEPRLRELLAEFEQTDSEETRAKINIQILELLEAEVPYVLNLLYEAREEMESGGEPRDPIAVFPEPGVPSIGQIVEKIRQLFGEPKAFDGTLERYGTASFPERTRLKEQNALRVAITMERQSDRDVALYLGSDETIEVDVYVGFSPEDFELQGSRLQTIQVPLEGDSEPVIFYLTPLQEGKKNISISFFRDARYLGTTELETVVVGEATSTKLASVPLDLPLNSAADSPDLTIFCERVSAGDGQFHYCYTLRSPLKELNQLKFQQFQNAETNVTLKKFVKRVQDQMNSSIFQSSSAMQFEEQLQTIGNSLYQQLFPEELKLSYWNDWRDRVESLAIIADDPWIPWEMVRPYHPERPELADEYLCERFDLARWFNGPGFQDSIQWKQMALVTNESRLPAASNEAREIEEIFGSADNVQPTLEAVLSLLKTGGFSNLHFICHASYSDMEHPEWSSLFLKNGEELHPVHLNGANLAFGKEQPFVFLNACETAKNAYELTGLGGWAEAFIKRAKSSGFIGSTWKASDRSAKEFAVSFYEALCGGETVAAAVRQARLQIKQSGDPTWLAYAVYANPLARLAISMDEEG